MTSKPFRRLKFIIYPIIFFFVWTNLGIYNIVQAATTEQGQESEGKGLSKQKTAEEKFQEAIDKIRENTEKAEEKLTKGETAETEEAEINIQKAEVEKLDVEIKKQFKATEEKIKDLPEVIKQRHRDFVKKYEENLTTLKASLDDIEKAKNKIEKEQAHKKVKDFLEKTKPPSKHTPLDPNKLPHRTPEIKKREPRTKPDEFKELKSENSRQYAQIPLSPPLLKGGIVGISPLLKRDIKLSPFEKGGMGGFRKPIFVASNGPLTGLVSDLPTFESVALPFMGNSSLLGINPNATSFLSPSPLAGEGWGEGILLAQAAADLPTPADLSETIEAQFTDDIKAKATELGNNPVKIYEWVRNNIEFVPTYGSIQGADMCLQTKQCNDFDTASLLIALLRTSNIPARYVYGTIELPIDKVMNWVGGFTDANSAVNFVASGGIPIKAYTSGGKIAKVQIEHVWVEGYVPYGNYRGTMRDQTGKTWIPVDSSYRQYEYNRGMDLYAAMGINGEKYLQDYITDTSSLAIPEELQASFPAYTISPYQYYSKRLFNYIDANYPSATYQDIFGSDTIETSKTITKKEYPYLLGSLPYKIITKGALYTSIPDNLRHSVTFSIQNPLTFDADLSYRTTLSEIPGKRITLSYIPATSTDEVLVTQYGGLLNVPPYLLNVKPVLKISGVTVATGNPVGLGQEQTFNMTFSVPNIGTEIVSNKVTAGDYSAIAILSNKVPFTLVGDKMETLINNVGSSDLDNLLGQMLYNVGVSYFHHLNYEEDLYAKNFQMIITKGLSEAMVTSHAVTDFLWGVPYRIVEGGVEIDVDKNIYLPFPFDGNKERTRDFMIVSGLGSSGWEDRVLQSFYDIPSVSAARLLRFANQQGIPIYTIDSTNINQLLSTLQVSSDVKTEIQNAINAGKKIVVSQSEVQYYDWKGIGYVVLDPTTGAGAYMISGGLMGGGTSGVLPFDLRNPANYSAWVTMYTRQMIVLLALSLVDTAYTWGGENTVCGFDCSGFIHYLFTTVYGQNIFGGQRLTASGQHNYLRNKFWIYSFLDKLLGDILWRSDYGHTGIYYEIFSVIHASGRPCKKNPDGSFAEPVPVQPELPPGCWNEIVIDSNTGEPTAICGRYRKVIITPYISPFFQGNAGIADDVGRPQP